MTPMTRTVKGFFAIAAALAAFAPGTPASAALITYVASGGVDTAPCTAAQPCATVQGGLNNTDNGGEVICLNAPESMQELGTQKSVTIDCPGVFLAYPAGFSLNGTNQKVTLRHMTFNGTHALSGLPAFQAMGSGSLILEDCAFERFTGVAINVIPAGPFNLVVTRSKMSNDATGIFVQPQSGGSATVKLDRVSIIKSTGAGLRTDSTNGPVAVDIVDSTFTDNAGNGINAIGGSGGTNVINISRSVIANSGGAGVQAKGANVGVLLDTTLLDSNANGAILTINGGNVVSYSNNRIVGSAGSGFSSNVPLQ